VSTREQLEERLAKAKAANAANVAARVERTELAALEAAAVREENALRDAPGIEKAEIEHGAGKIATVVTCLGAIVVRRPHVAAYRRFQDQASSKSEDVIKLVRPCVVYPTAAELDRILDEQPGTLALLAEAVATLAGAAQQERQGK
jgi:hypothetical protein